METRLYLLGFPRIDHGGPAGPPERRKALALAAYLALAERPRGRDEIAATLWPELGQDRARAALRSTLPDLTARLPEGALLADRRTAWLRPGAIWVDALAFQALVAAQPGHAHAREALCDGCLARHREAAALYGADLLQGFSLPDSPEFEAWQTARREALRAELAEALRRLALALAGRGPEGQDEALGHGRRLLEIDPLDEPAHRLLMRLYADAGRRGEALRQYQACAATLERELGVEPAPETQALLHEISARGAAPAPPAARRPPLAGQLPPEPGSFVGRETELAQALTRLADPDCRLLTITGPGGIGKTRLAQRAARAAAAGFADGARFVALGDATSAAQATAAAARALGVSLTGTERTNEPLLAALRGRELLLVLDNFEQLVGEAALVLELLGAAPGLKLIVTSRERLALRAESIIPLEGLAVPRSDAGAGGSSAVELFVQRARQVRPGFALAPENAAAITRICELVGGVPLGIELAAAWARSLTPAEIAAQIERGPDFLRSPLRDLPERHRSLRAVFTHSWQLLEPAERAAFSRLGVFRGGFSAEAAEAVAGAEAAELAALEEKSLLRRGQGGRYSFHLLLHQYAAERLAERPAEAAERRALHGRHYARLARGLGESLRGAGQPAAMAMIAEEAPNLRAAWEWAVAEGDREAIGAMLDCVALYNELRGRRQEGNEALAAAAAALEGAGDDGLLARVLAWRGRLLAMRNCHEAAEAALARAVAIAEARSDAQTLAFCLASRGIMANMRGSHGRAVSLLTRSISAYQGSDDHSAVGDALNRLGGAYYDLGDLAEARRRWQASYACFERAGDLSGMARGLNNLGEAARTLGAFAEARRLAERSLALLEQIGHGWQAQYPLLSLALLELFAGRPGRAAAVAGRSLELSRRIDDRRGVATALVRLAEVSLSEGRLDAAHAGYEEAAAIFRSIDRRQGVGLCLGGLAEVALARGAYGEAAGLAREALDLARASEARLAAGEALCSLGLALGHGGDLAAGEAALREAAAIFAEAGARPDAAEAWARLATLLASAPDGQLQQRRARAAALAAGIAEEPAARASTRARAAAVAAALAAS